MFRRLIFCKIKKGDDLKQFLQILKEDDWKSDYWGKRGAKYSLTKKDSEETRYHLRIYRIENYYYVLVHKEPTVLGNINFHVKGLLDRLKSTFKSQKEYLTDDDKLELANYEEGNEYLSELVNKKKVLNKICKFDLEESELKLFSSIFGIVSLKLPFEILIEDLGEAIGSENAHNFYLILKKLMNILEFRLISPTHKDFLIFESPSVKNFKLYIKRIRINKIDVDKIREDIFDYGEVYVILIPMKHDNIPPNIIEILEKNRIGIIHSMMFLKLFNIYSSSPYSHEKLHELVKIHGLIDSNDIDEIFQPLDISELSKNTLEVFRFLKEQNDWVYLDLLINEFIKNKKFPKKEGKLILQFLTHPLINLVITKKEKRLLRKDRTMYRAIKNFDEIQYRLKTVKKLLNNII
ncbi:MAG: hypothetical protein EAX96_02760 [Candidatus Lokiarchaeota archaeon]|nr:hypothetical protein [Candidatus Lokiarchaeota archaeon]